MKKMSPAAKSMIQLLSYIVLMIVIWTVIGLIAFPKPSTAERMTEYVTKNEAVLIQVAGNAMDEEVNPGIMNSVEVLEILGEEHIAEVESYAQGAVFHIVQDSTNDNGSLDLIYLPDGQYAFTREGDWTAASPDENGTLRWVSGNTVVAVNKLSDCFFLEETTIDTH